jgi:hypothetical protein
MGGDRKKYHNHPESNRRGKETDRQSMGASVLQAQMQLEKALGKKREFEASERRRGRAGDKEYEKKYQSWVRSKIEGMDQEIDELTRKIERLQRKSTEDAHQTETNYSYGSQDYAYSEGYGYGAESSGGIKRMGTIARAQLDNLGYYDSWSAAGGDQDSTQRSSFVEDALQQERDLLVQQNPGWWAQQERQWSDEQRRQRGRRRPPNQDG